MAKLAKQQNRLNNTENQIQLLYGDDALSKYWNSSLFNAVYLKHDISHKHPNWKDDDDVDFQNFMNSTRNLAVEYKNRERELSNWSETETINNWIKHILQALGWTNNCTGLQNPFLEETSFRYGNNSYRTDILIVDHPKEKQYVNQAEGDDKLKEARQTVLLPVEVKYWQRLEEYRQGQSEKKGRNDKVADDITRSTTPNEQIVRYMQILKKEWGILTDGARWRLFNLDLSSEDAERHYEFNFFALFQAFTSEQTELDSIELTEAAKYFYHFFSKFTFFPKNAATRPFVEEVLQYSKKYVNKVEDDLKDRFVKAMNIACNGLLKATKNVNLTQDLVVIRNVSESTLFNVLFIKSLESRNVLPMASTDYRKLSLTSIIDKIELYSPEKEEMLNNRELERAFKRGNGNAFNYNPEGTELHDRILRLTKIIHKGTSRKDSFGFEISGFRESIFSDEEWELLNQSKLTNQTWVKILFELGYAESEYLGSRKYQQIPYSYFTPRQLGSIYESFLEYKIDRADSNMIFEKKQWKPVNFEAKSYKQSDLPTVKQGDLFFTPNNKDRKATGSYYTPDYIVQYIVKETITPLLANKKQQEILKLKVCDPAMGSGHFLSGALKYLAAAYLNAGEDSNIMLSDVKALILHNCIYGADLNPRAVKLAKLSLWLETASTNKKLEELEDQLKIGNSLSKSFDWHKKFPDAFKFGGFDIVIGNPPWGGELTNADRESLSQIYPLVSVGCTNTFKFFSDLGFRILNNQGEFGYIIPNTFLVQPKYLDLKDFFLTKQIRKVINLGDGIFGKDVNAPCAIVIASNNKSFEKLGTLPILDLSSLPTNQKQVALEGNNRKFETIRSQRRKEVNCALFNELIDAKDCGIKHQRNGCGLENKGKSDLSDRLYYVGKQKSSSDICYLNGTDLDISGFFIEKCSDKYLRGNFKNILNDNETVYFNKAMMEAPKKLLWRQTADRPICAIGGKMYFANTLQAGLLTSKAKDLGLSYEYMCCIINSTWFRFLYLKSVMEKGRVFPQVKLTYLRSMPIALPNKTQLAGR